MNRLLLINVIWLALLTSPFAYLIYRIAIADRRAGTGDAVSFVVTFVVSAAVAQLTVQRTIALPTTVWQFTLMVAIYVIAAAGAMTILRWVLRPFIRAAQASFLVYVGVVFIAFLCQMFVTRYILMVYYLEDVGLHNPALTEARIGSPGGPHVGFSSHLGYYLLRPARGSVVTIRGEGLSRLPAAWHDELPERFHFIGGPNGVGTYFGRVVGMPGETVVLERGNVLVNGVRLTEAYVHNRITSNEKVTVRLGETDYLLAEDVRRDDDPSLNPFYVAHERQVLSRQFFIVWPLESFGFVRPPGYNVSNPGMWKLRLSGKLVERLVKM